MKSFIFNNPRSLLLGSLMLFIASLGWAQQTSGDISPTSTAVRVIDNKGTIKYLQSSNGITTLTNSTANVTTTTWQLGGTLIEDTYIDVNDKVFGFDRIELVDVTSLAASTNASTQSLHGTGTGWTLLVRDEATGEVKKLLATDLLQGGHHYDELTADQNADYPITVNGVSTDYKKVSVYRNGAKLVGGDNTSSTTWTNDYTVTTNLVTIEVGGPGEIPALYATDIIEIQWVK